MGSLSNMEGAGKAEKVKLSADSLCPTCGQPVPQAGARAEPEWEPPEQIKVLEGRMHEHLTERFPNFKYHIWLRPLRLLWRERDHLTFTAPAHIRTSFEERYMTVVVGMLREAGWGSVTADVVEESWRPSAEQLAAGVKGAPPPAPAREAVAAEPPEPEPEATPYIEVRDDPPANARRYRHPGCGAWTVPLDDCPRHDDEECNECCQVFPTRWIEEPAPAAPGPRRRRRSDVQ